MKVRLQADNDLDFRIVTATGHLNSRIDFQSAYQAGLHGKTDPEVLAIAARDNRIVVSHDRRTMPKHFGDFIENQPSPGLIVMSKKLGIAKSAEWLHLIWEASEAEEYLNIVFQISD
jgi:Domain of unknown function (DUF5615)